MQPLSGVKVVDLTHALAGSFCTYHLGLLGADIVKVEPPRHGDEFRAWRPTTFAAANAGKRSMTLDLKSAKGREVLYRLVAGADVLTENFRPGVNVKLGLDWEKLKAINPRLIYCSVSGFGQDGALRDYPAIEWSVQAVSGITDTYVSKTEDPRRLGISILDPFAGYMAYSAILAALLQRDKTGIGQRVDVGMLDAGWVLNATSVTDMLEGMRPVSATLRGSSGRFMAKDRPLFISFNWPKWFAALCEIVEAPDLASDPRFADEPARNANAEALIRLLQDKLAARTAAEWERAFVARGIPAGVVRTIPELAAEVDMERRGLINKVTLGDKTVSVVGAGFRFEHDGPRLQRGVPALGDATDDVLAGLGYSAAEVGEMRNQGVI